MGNAKLVTPLLQPPIKKAAPPKKNKPFFGATMQPNAKTVATNSPLLAEGITKKDASASEQKKPTRSNKSNRNAPLLQPLKEIKSTSLKYQKHGDPQIISDQKFDAALLPKEKANELAANKQHADSVPEEKKDFDKTAFQLKLETEIKKTIASKAAAQKVAKNGVDTTEVKNALTEEKNKAGGSIERSINAEVPTISGAAVPTPLKRSEAISKTQLPDNANLAPAKKSKVETDFTTETKGLDDQYSQNNLSKDKLQKSDEKSFIAADNQKSDSQQKAKDLTKQYKANERSIIAKTKDSNSNAISNAYSEMLTKNTGVNSENYSKQNEKSKAENQTRVEIAKSLDKIFIDTNKLVSGYFKAIDDYVVNVFGRDINFYLVLFSVRVAGLLDENTGVLNNIGAFVTGDDLLSEGQIFVIAKDEFIENMKSPIDKLVSCVDTNLTNASNQVKKGKDEQQKYWDSLPKKDQKVAGDIYNISINQFKELETSIESKENSIVDNVVEKFKSALDDLDARFEKAKIENMSWLDNAIAAVKAVVNTIIELKNAIKSIAKKAAQYAEEIIDDPITFFGNLGDGVGLGFKNFKKNIDKHLVKGVLEWLTGSIGSEIILPKELDPGGILDLVLQILGITIKKIKEIIIGIIGKERFEFIENGVDATIAAGNKILNIFKILKEKGIVGLWEFIVEEFGNLKEMLIENVKTFVVETIAMKAMEMLLSLLIPGAGFIRAAQLLIKFVVTLFQKAAQIVKIIDGVIESFGNILRKDIAGAAAKVENVLSGFISLAISFLAAVLGLNGIVAKVQKFIREKIKPKIEKILHNIGLKIKLIAEKIGLIKLIDKSMAAVQKGKAWVEDKKEKAKDVAKKYGEKFLNFLGIKKKFKTEDGETHSLYFVGKEGDLTLMVASEPKTFSDFLKSISSSAIKADKATIKKNAETEFDALRTALGKKNMGGSNDEYQKEQTEKFEKVTKHVNTLSNYMPPLFGIEGIGTFELKFGPLNTSGYGTKMEIKNLHKSTRPPIGSVPGVSNDSYDTLKKKRNGGSTYYILGHLLNHNLGGSGNDFRNLTPLTRKGNKDHNADIEEMVKQDLNAGKVINYTVNPDYTSPNVVKNKPDLISEEKKKVVATEEKTPVKVNYIFESWEKDKPSEKNSKTDSFNNETDFFEKAVYTA